MNSASAAWRTRSGQAPGSATWRGSMTLRVGLTQDDPHACMLIVQLRVADQIAESYKQRSQEEKAFIIEIRQLPRELHRLVTRVGKVRAKFGNRREVRLNWEDFNVFPVEVDTYRKRSPLRSYLAGAFRRPIGVLKAGKRIEAACRDLVRVVGIAAIINVVGMVTERRLSG